MNKERQKIEEILLRPEFQINSLLVPVIREMIMDVVEEAVDNAKAV